MRCGPRHHSERPGEARTLQRIRVAWGHESSKKDGGMGAKCEMECGGGCLGVARVRGAGTRRSAVVRSGMEPRECQCASASVCRSPPPSHA